MPKPNMKPKQDAIPGRVYAVWRPGHFGKIIRQGAEVSEVRWEDKFPDNAISNYYLYDESVSLARARVLTRLARIRIGLP